MSKKYLVQLKPCLLLLGFQKEALQYFENKHKGKCFNENMFGGYLQWVSYGRHHLLCTMMFLGLELEFVCVQQYCLPTKCFVQKSINRRHQKFKHIRILKIENFHYFMTQSVNLYQMS